MNKMMNLIIVVSLQLFLFELNSLAEDKCYEDTIYKKYISLSNQYLFISSVSQDSTQLKCLPGEIPVKASWFEFLARERIYSWKKTDWLSIRLANNTDSNYIDTVVFNKMCPGKFKRNKYGSTNQRPDCVVGPPIITSIGHYVNVKQEKSVDAANIFEISVCDSVNLGLAIDTLFDGKQYGTAANKVKTLDRSKVKKLTYDVVVTPKSTKGYGGDVDYQYFAKFSSHPEFKLFHLADDFGLFVIWGREIDGDGITVHEIIISPFAVKSTCKLTDLYIGDEIIHQTDYFIKNGILRRKVTQKDSQTGRYNYHQIKWDGMWLPDNRGD